MLLFLACCRGRHPLISGVGLEPGKAAESQAGAAHIKDQEHNVEAPSDSLAQPSLFQCSASPEVHG